MLLIGRTLDQEKEEAAEAVGKTDGKIDQRVSVFGFEGMITVTISINNNS